MPADDEQLQEFSLQATACDQRERKLLCQPAVVRHVRLAFLAAVVVVSEAAVAPMLRVHEVHVGRRLRPYVGSGGQRALLNIVWCVCDK
jgi:hypothetical protein